MTTCTQARYEHTDPIVRLIAAVLDDNALAASVDVAEQIAEQIALDTICDQCDAHDHLVVLRPWRTA